MHSCLSEKIEKYAVILVGLLFLRTWIFSPEALNFLFWINHNITRGGSFIVLSFCILNDTLHEWASLPLETGEGFYYAFIMYTVCFLFP